MKTVTQADSCDYLNENPYCMHIEKSKIFVKSYYRMVKIPKGCKGPANQLDLHSNLYAWLKNVCFVQKK